MARPPATPICTGSRLAAAVLAAAGLLLILLLVRRWQWRWNDRDGERDGHQASQTSQASQASQAKLFYVYMEGCAHCKHFDGAWTAFVDRYRSSLEGVGVSASRIRSDDATAKRLGVSGYPSILLVSTTGAFPPRLFDGPRTSVNLASFVKESFPAFPA